VRQRVVVYVERGDELLVFDHRDDPEAGTQVPAGGVLDGEALSAAVVREVREETGLELRAEPEYLGEHEHLDGLGRASRSSFFRVEAPAEAPAAWEHVVDGGGRGRRSRLLLPLRRSPVAVAGAGRLPTTVTKQAHSWHDRPRSPRYRRDRD
jgi:ADP-ribose pyrophosphatase YjhB (NUDIX family)